MTVIVKLHKIILLLSNYGTYICIQILYTKFINYYGTDVVHISDEDQFNL